MRKWFLTAGIGLMAILSIVFFARPAVAPVLAPGDHLNTSYIIAGQPVALKEGVAAVPAAPGSAALVTTRYFGNEAEYDFNGDGAPDKAFLITQETAGSGAFFYLVVALRDGSGYRGSEAVYIGDRIAPQTTNVDENGLILVNYADRAPGEPFTARPSQGKTLRLKFDPAALTLGEVVADFEGEADPARMTLAMKVWIWERAEHADGSVRVVPESDRFTLTFADGTVSIVTDCNLLSARYLTRQSALTFSEISGTEKSCEGSQEGAFVALLAETVSYRFTGRGELIFERANERGSAVFR